MGTLSGRPTKERDGKQWAFPLAEGAKITLGAMVALNSSGLAVPAAAAAGLTVVGVAESFHDVGEHPYVIARRGCFAFDAAGTGVPATADVGKAVYVAGASTVSTTASSGGQTPVSYPQAGILLGVDDDGCWVRI